MAAFSSTFRQLAGSLHRDSGGLRVLLFRHRHHSVGINCSITKEEDAVLVNWDFQESSANRPKIQWSRFHYIWLRDNCQCSKCYSCATQQRILDTANVPTDIQASQITVLGDDTQSIKIEWQDGHYSSFDSEWLRENAYENDFEVDAETKKSNAKLKPNTPVSWGAEIALNPPQVSYNGLVASDDHAFLDWGAKMEKYGFCLIEDTPINLDSSETILSRVGVIRNTMFGKIWDISNSADIDKIEFGDTAYTTLGIDPHTDGNYFFEAPGLQLLHCLHFSGTGGLNVLVDGLKLAETIKAENTRHFDILTKLKISYRYADWGHIYCSSHVPFTTDPTTGEFTGVHFNNCDRLPLTTLAVKNLRQDMGEDISMVDIYAAMQTLLRATKNEKFLYQFRLSPGTPVIFDNYRVLHARNAFAGERRFTGGYVNREDWRSKIMVAREQLNNP